MQTVIVCVVIIAAACHLVFRARRTLKGKGGCGCGCGGCGGACHAGLKASSCRKSGVDR
ncbi:MAG: FeoB-associated Cys-rich membrane protein [Mailhella sp.]|nr:FeoB-associated Cys-rich membrane protein [Mailhella sp.]